MNATARVMGFLCILLSLCGGLLYWRGAQVEHRLREEVAQSKLDLEQTKTALAETKANLGTTTSQLEATRTELLTASTERSKSSKQSAALAGLLSRKSTLEKIRDVTLYDDMKQLVEAEAVLTRTPSDTAFSSLKAAYAKLRSTIQSMTPLFQEMKAYISSNRDDLRNSEAAVKALDSELQAAETNFPKLVQKIDRRMEACQNAKLGVMASQGWQVTDLGVESGEIVVATASGRWTYTTIGKRTVDERGEEWDDKYKSVLGLPNAALIARVHGEETARLATLAYRCPRDGKIELRINDSVVGDNSGTIDCLLWKFRPFNDE